MEVTPPNRTYFKWILLIFCVKSTQQCRLNVGKKPFYVYKGKNIRSNPKK